MTMDIDAVRRQWAREIPEANLSGLAMALRLTRIGKLMDLHFSAYCREAHGLRSQDMRVLLALHRSGTPYALRPTDLFRSLLVTSGAITKQVDRLSERGLVRRTPDSDHGGGWLVQLTPAGLKVADTTIRHHCFEPSISLALAELLQSYEANKRKQVESFMIDVLRVVEEIAGGLAPRK